MNTKLNNRNKFFYEINAGQVFKEPDGFNVFMKTDTITNVHSEFNAVRLFDGSHCIFLDKSPIVCVDGMFVEDYNE